MKDSTRKTLIFLIAAIAGLAIVLVWTLPGCAPANEEQEEMVVSEQAQGSSYSMASLDALMGELSGAATLEEAEELIGTPGERTGEHVNPSDTTVTYEWDLDESVSVEGRYITYSSNNNEDYATYETKYVIAEVKDKVDFPDRDTLKARLDSKEELTYDELVRMLGGNPGLREKVSTLGGVTYIWYGKDGGYLWTWVDVEGVCTTTSAYY